MTVRPAPAVHRDLAWALKQQATRAGESAPSVRGADWRTAVVTTVNGDGTVAVDGIPAIRCLETYALPAVGDVAVISQSSNGNWIAWGRTSTGAGWTPITLASGWAANANYYTPAYRLWGDGTASLCGLASMSGTLATGTVAATLPAPARPASQVRVAAQVAVGYFGVITLFPNGQVQLGDFNATLPTTGPKYLQLDTLGRYRLA
ncbi:hypothetical protein [Streptomyces mutabilis]|uniref:hypothetical protein n=1 Tax=Streptomyces mutabilis TaxID=67332 RepID=UPI00367DB64F